MKYFQPKPSNSRVDLCRFTVVETNAAETRDETNVLREEIAAIYEEISANKCPRSEAILTVQLLSETDGVYYTKVSLSETDVWSHSVKPARGDICRCCRYFLGADG